jgi:hypothetical protein
MTNWYQVQGVAEGEAIQIASAARLLSRSFWIDYSPYPFDCPFDGLRARLRTGLGQYVTLSIASAAQVRGEQIGQQPGARL